MNPHFFRATAARFLFSLAVQCQAVLMGWQMYELTHDPLKLGLIGLTEALPALSLALISGYLVDRLNPLILYRSVVGVSFLSVLLSWNARSPRDLFMAALLTGIARSFSGPSMGAIIPRLVTREEIKRVSAYTAFSFQFAGVVGPGLAGILLGIHGYRYPYLLSVLGLILASLMLLKVEYRHIPVPHEAGFRSKFVSELLSGMRYVFRHPLLLSSMSLDMFAVLFGGVTAILPVFAAEVLFVGPSGLGWLRAAPALGAMVMGVALIRRPVAQNAGKALLLSVLGFGVCILVFGISRIYILSWFALAMSGALDSVSMVVRNSILQLCSPEKMRGRIGAVSSIFIGSSNEIGGFESGAAAKLMGTVPSVIFGGTMTLLTVAVTLFRCPQLWKLDLTRLEKVES